MCPAKREIYVTLKKENMKTNENECGGNKKTERKMRTRYRKTRNYWEKERDLEM